MNWISKGLKAKDGQSSKQLSSKFSGKEGHIEVQHRDLLSSSKTPIWPFMSSLNKLIIHEYMWIFINIQKSLRYFITMGTLFPMGYCKWVFHPCYFECCYGFIQGFFFFGLNRMQNYLKHSNVLKQTCILKHKRFIFTNLKCKVRACENFQDYICMSW